MGYDSSYAENFPNQFTEEVDVDFEMEENKQYCIVTPKQELLLLEYKCSEEISELWVTAPDANEIQKVKLLNNDRNYIIGVKGHNTKRRYIAIFIVSIVGDIYELIHKHKGEKAIA